ncbi:transporter substrate-binding domain-containing protein [Epibacterium ulvae]|uniref:substrate-binding periplasmic protein n=1 Tax=Epibacterium ulvae TaxID=1156985 RepID=UPI001BFC628D|nr:transporter substrate-binding domain-containing protein [Epibacterium ulvae]MBT8154122.1 transporter substrate-binding domain-containing protein [Epibacterium ulvae]
MRTLRDIFLAAALALGLPTLSSAETLKIVADEWPPFSGASLPSKGISLDVICEVLKRAGYQVETEVVPWARIMNGATSGQYDVIGSLFFDPALESYLTYADAFYETDVRLVQRSGAEHAYTSVDALRPFSIAVGDGFLYQDEFDRADYLNKVVVTTTLQAVQMVAHARVDLTLDSVDVVNYAVHSDDPTLNGRVEFAPGVLATQGIHMAVRNDLPNRDQVIQEFNTTLAAMRADGSLAKVLKKHVGP